MGPAGALAWVGTLLGAAGPAHAAGGHYAVDDAALLDPGQCQVELWQERTAASREWLNHVGPACRWGAFEWGLNLDQLREADRVSQHAYGPQVKWATPLTTEVSIGFAAASTWKSRNARYAGTNLLIPVTWQASNTLAVHLNAGIDLRPGAASQARRGLALEWTPQLVNGWNEGPNGGARWSFLAERFDDHGERHWRAGVRYALTENLSLDASRAAYLGPTTRPWWALGLNWAFSPGGRSGAAM